MTDERRAYTRLGQRARANERASRARAHTIRISRAQLPCLVAHSNSRSGLSGVWPLGLLPLCTLHSIICRPTEVAQRCSKSSPWEQE